MITNLTDLASCVTADHWGWIVDWPDRLVWNLTIAALLASAGDQAIAEYRKVAAFATLTPDAVRRACGNVTAEDLPEPERRRLYLEAFAHGVEASADVRGGYAGDSAAYLRRWGPA